MNNVSEVDAAACELGRKMNILSFCFQNGSNHYNKNMWFLNKVARKVFEFQVTFAQIILLKHDCITYK